MRSIDTDAQFVYNENGLWIQKTVNGVATKYTLHGKNVVHMTQGGNELHFFYDAQNRPAGLDPNERIRFRNLISELSEDRLVLLSTHIVSDIEYIANEILLMKDGKLMHKGTADEIINSMTETVWECFVEKNMVSDFMKKYKISNMKSEADGVILRIISHEKPFVNAQSVEASLEDVFLYYFGEKAGDENAAI